MTIQWVSFAGVRMPPPKDPWGKRVGAFLRRHWKALVAAAVLAGGTIVAAMLRMRMRKAVPDAGRPAAVLPDPALALVPLGEVKVALDRVDQVTRADAAQDAQEAKEAHAAVDAATTIAGVDAVLYGREHDARPCGGSSPPADGGAGAAGGDHV